MPLLSLVASSPEAVRQLNIEQVVATAGDGRLRDGTESQRELREYLRQVSIDALATYADHCLSKAFPKGGQVLQDIVNELGRRLEYEVTNGRYQGTTNTVGFDSIWRDPAGHGLVVEVKTTDAYRLSLETVAG
jgi:radical SAM superfamily enzyme with C-terminal helix-hairpin-helix motif